MSQFCGCFNFFLRGIEFSKTDIFCYGSREQMGILQNDTEGVAQSVFFDIFYINAVVDNRTALDRFVIVVFPAPVEPTKAIFWPGLAYRLMFFKIRRSAV